MRRVVTALPLFSPSPSFKAMLEEYARSLSYTNSNTSLPGSASGSPPNSSSHHSNQTSSFLSNTSKSPADTCTAIDALISQHLNLNTSKDARYSEYDNRWYGARSAEDVEAFMEAVRGAGAGSLGAKGNARGRG